MAHSGPQIDSTCGSGVEGGVCGGGGGEGMRGRTSAVTCLLYIKAVSWPGIIFIFSEFRGCVKVEVAVLGSRP